MMTEDELLGLSPDVATAVSPLVEAFRTLKEALPHFEGTITFDFLNEKTVIKATMAADPEKAMSHFRQVHYRSE